MRNGLQTRAEIALIDLEWFARWLQQAIAETRDKADKRNTARLILDATQQLREIRQSYPPARPQMGRGA